MRRAVAIGCAALAACAELPPAPGPATAVPPSPASAREAVPSAARSAAIARHAALAQAASDAGDHATALAHREVLMLLDPANAAHRQAAEASRAAIERGVRTELAAGAAARRAGDGPRARDAFLRALALDPRNAEAAAALREIERQQMARTQADRAARARALDAVVADARSRAQAQSQAEGYDLEQRIELVRSGDASAGLREARAWVDANAGDRDGRARLAAAASERAREAERKGQREIALTLYEGANTLATSPSPEWTAKARELRRALGDAQYAEGMRALRTDLAVAIRHFEAAVRYDPGNTKAQQRLRDARLAADKLRSIAPR